MRWNVALIFLCITLGCFSCRASSSNGYRILGLFPVPIRSHYAFYETLLLELSKRGHEVDVITHYPRGETIKNFNELSVAGSMPTLENNMSIANHDEKSFLRFAGEFVELGNRACASVLKHPVISEMKTPRKAYDLIVAEVFVTDCLLPLAHIYEAPVIGISSAGIMPWADERMGNPDNPAYIPNYFLPLRGRLSFLEKCASTATNVASKAWYFLMLTLPAEIRGREVFGSVPAIENIAKDTMILLANRHFSVDGPRPLVPGVIEIGGMHIDAPGKIQPQKLSDFIEKSQNGVVYFSMGTLINMETFDQTRLLAILKVFGNLKQNVLMRLPQNVVSNLNLELSGNIYVSDVFPQVDVLCHPNTRLFITHGGLLSIQEAAHCGVPIIGMPFYPQQEVNVKNFVSKMAGIQIDYSGLEEATFKAFIESVLNNGTYKANALKLSNVFKDRPTKPLETAVFWTEYALKHGGRHIRSPSADLIVFEYLLIDVALLGVAVGLIVMYMLHAMLQFLQQLFDRPLPPKYAEESKQRSKED